ncbi:MAG: YqgE/AlgH family protein [Chitinophagaceae bacterium]|nr:MAG: YqgE/AlgH family protein [Chitinophagaceae bacterium]
MVLLVECNEEGAVGLVINKVFDRSLNALAEFSQSPALPLYAGGPVDTEHLFFIHRRPDLVPDSQAVTRDICYGGNFKKAIDYINRQMLMEEDIKICIGYCGWDSGDLEAEIAEGSWRIKEANADVVFSRRPTI